MYTLATIQAKGVVMAYYIKKPSDVVWGFTAGSLGQYTYSSATSTNFELDAIEQTEVILNILMYAAGNNKRSTDSSNSSFNGATR